MEKSAAPRDARWQERYDDIPRLVASAETVPAVFERHPDAVCASEGVRQTGARGRPNASGPSAAGGAGTGAGGGNAGGGGTGTASTPPPLIEARAFVLRDPKTLTKRQQLYGTQLIRKFGSATFAPSGSGKTNLMIVEALAMVTGRALLGILPPQRVRVWYWNGEDPYDELERRIGAACLHYGITAAGA